MTVVEAFGKIENCWVDEINNWNQEKVTNLWSNIGHKHIFAKYSDVSDSRVEGSSWITLLNKMTRKGAFKRKREDCLNDMEWNRSIYSHCT